MEGWRFFWNAVYNVYAYTSSYVVWTLYEANDDGCDNATTYTMLSFNDPQCPSVRPSVCPHAQCHY